MAILPDKSNFPPNFDNFQKVQKHSNKYCACFQLGNYELIWTIGLGSLGYDGYFAKRIQNFAFKKKFKTT